MQEAWPGSAPPAPIFEAAQQRGSEHALAQAVLMGLPAHDETLAVARAAAAAGKSIQEVAEWARGVDYTATAYRCKARGRIQAPGAPVRGAAAGCSWASACPRSLPCAQLAGQALQRNRPALPRPPCGLQESLYAEAASWVNPHELEAQLAAAAQRRKRKLHGEELRAVMERKKEMKRQKQQGWLYT